MAGVLAVMKMSTLASCTSSSQACTLSCGRRSEGSGQQGWGHPCACQRCGYTLGHRPLLWVPCLYAGCVQVVHDIVMHVFVTGCTSAVVAMVQTGSSSGGDTHACVKVCGYSLVACDLCGVGATAGCWLWEGTVAGWAHPPYSLLPSVAGAAQARAAVVATRLCQRSGCSLVAPMTCVVWIPWLTAGCGKALSRNGHTLLTACCRLWHVRHRQEQQCWWHTCVPSVACNLGPFGPVCCGCHG
jgi:hypothetical protein